MLAMQYSIPLPENYGLERVRQRVNARKALFDGHGGLVHKSFLYNASENLYAPFYVWKDANEAQSFLLDDLFHGVIKDFSRCRVRSWFAVHLACGDRGLQPAFARREADVIAPEEKLDAFLEAEKKAQEELLKLPGLYMHVVAFDADRWEVLRFSLWKDKAAAARSFSDTILEYEVLHVCEA